MKKFKFMLYLSIMGLCLFSIQAQEVNIPTSITCKVGLGPETQSVAFFGNTDTLFNPVDIAVGSNIPIVDTTVTFGMGFTRFQPVVQSGINGANKVSFNIRPKVGYGFELTRISFDCVRYGTDGSLINVIWKSDYFMDSTTLAKSIKPNRNNSEAATHLDSSYTALSIPAQPFNSSLDIYIYDLGNTKQVGLGNVTIYGNVKSFAVDDTSGKAFTKIAWAIPQSIIYGTALGDEQLNAAAEGNTSIPVYDPAQGTILPAGEHNLKVTFPADPKYSSGNKTIPIQVLKATSKITWENPEPITEGTALSSAQLNATTDGSTGPPTYTPTLGTILGAGKHTLSVSFAADDNYVQATKIVTIEVTGPLSISGISPGDVLAYPNPVRNELNVTVHNGMQGAKMTLSSIEGRVLLMENLKQVENTINIEKIPAGIYILQVMTNKGTVTQSIIKN